MDLINVLTQRQRQLRHTQDLVVSQPCGDHINQTNQTLAEDTATTFKPVLMESLTTISNTLNDINQHKKSSVSEVILSRIKTINTLLDKQMLVVDKVKTIDQSANQLDKYVDNYLKEADKEGLIKLDDVHSLTLKRDQLIKRINELSPKVMQIMELKNEINRLSQSMKQLTDKYNGLLAKNIAFKCRIQTMINKKNELKLKRKRLKTSHNYHLKSF